MKNIGKAKKKNTIWRILAVLFSTIMALSFWNFAVFLLDRIPSVESKVFAQEKEAPSPPAASSSLYLTTGSHTPSGNKKIISVPHLSQTKNYPTGCEIVSTAMLLQFYGYNLPVDALIDNYLDQADLTVLNGQRYGADPNASFIGSPYSPFSYGCYAPVILNTLSRVLTTGDRATNLTGTPFSQLISDYIERGIPVLVWASIGMKPVVKTAAWRQNNTDEVVYWPKGEHCLVLVGYDENRYYFNDPLQSTAPVGYEKSSVEQRYAELGSQAVAVAG